MGIDLPISIRRRALSAMKPGDALNPIPTKPRRAKSGTGAFAIRKRAKLEALRSERAGPVDVTVPIRCQNSLNVREHFGKRAARANQHHLLVGAYLRRLPLPAMPVVVKLTRYGPKRMDGDGNEAALKHCRDSVAVVYGVDDGDARWTWDYDQETGKGVEYAVRIQINRRDL